MDSGTIAVVALVVLNVAQFVVFALERRKVTDLLAARSYSDYAAGQKIMRNGRRNDSGARDPYLEYASSPLVE